MARLYSNENFPLPAVEKLCALGHDVLTTQDASKADQAVPDDEVLKFATSEKRAVLTLNRRHFMRLHRENAAHAGIIACKFTRTSAAGIIERRNDSGKSSMNPGATSPQLRQREHATKSVPARDNVGVADRSRNDQSHLRSRPHTDATEYFLRTDQSLGRRAISQ